MELQESRRWVLRKGGGSKALGDRAARGGAGSEGSEDRWHTVPALLLCPEGLPPWGQHCALARTCRFILPPHSHITLLNLNLLTLPARYIPSCSLLPPGRVHAV